MAPISPNGKDMGRYLALGQVGLEMVAPIGIGLAVDYYAGSGPWGLIVGTIVGFAGGLFHLVHLANKLGAQDSRQDSKGPDADTK